jgi:aspartyl-tRNA synthetase
VNEKDNKLQFGDYRVIASQSQTHRQFVDAKTLGCDDGPKVGELVWLRGRVASVRGKGNACFIVIRSDTFYTVQACHFKDKETPDDSKSLIKYATSLPCESIVDILGVVSAADVKSCTQSKVELQIKKIFAVSRAPIVLPFSLDDAGRSQAVIEASQEQDSSFVGVSQVHSTYDFLYSMLRFLLVQDIRLNNRWLDLRVPANNAIMRVRSGVSLLFREALHGEGFVEINTPKLIAGSSEGGSEVFTTDYFGQVDYFQMLFMCLVYLDIYTARLFGPIAPAVQADGNFSRPEQGLRDRPGLQGGEVHDETPSVRVHRPGLGDGHHGALQRGAGRCVLLCSS